MQRNLAPPAKLKTPLSLGVLAFLACLAPTATAQDPRPLGAWFGGYERLTFDDEVAWPGGAYVVSHYADAEFYTPFRVADLGRYSAVLLGRSGGKALPKDEQETLRKWVADGGALLLSGEEGQRLFGNTPPDWLGIASWAFNKPLKCAVQQADHPLARGLREIDAKDPAWETTAAVIGKPGSVSVIGKDGAALLLVATHGKGRIVYTARSDWLTASPGTPGSLRIPRSPARCGRGTGAST